LNASLVVNPVAGGNDSGHINNIEILLKDKVSVSTYVTRKKGDAFSYAKTVSDTDLLIIAGGDGTINEVINGIMSSENNGQRNIPLAIIPLGTANVLAKELGIPEDIHKAVNRALTGESHKISLGRINGRFFSLMAGIGFDGEAVLGVRNDIIKKISGKAAYVVSGMKVLGTYNPPLITIKTGEDELSGYTALVGNAHYYGGHFSVTPKSSVTEPILDICLFKGKTKTDMVRLIMGVIRKKHLDYDDVSYIKAREVEVTSDSTVHIQVDGDYFGTLPVRIDVVKDALSFIW
jgi:YegS/Rv2252/BmrU family lipid kinase